MAELRPGFLPLTSFRPLAAGERRRLVWWAQALAWASLGWMTVEGVVGVGAGIAAGSIALIGFGISSGVEGLASVIVIWRFWGRRALSEQAELRAQKAVAISFWLLAPYVAIEAVRQLISRSEPETSWLGIAVTSIAMVLMPVFGIAKRRIGSRLNSAATAGEGTQNMLCAYLSVAVLAGLLLNAWLGWWWADPLAALFIAGVAVKEGRESWKGEVCCDHC